MDARIDRRHRQGPTPGRPRPCIDSMNSMLDDALDHGARVTVALVESLGCAEAVDQLEVRLDSLLSDRRRMLRVDADGLLVLLVMTDRFEQLPVRELVHAANHRGVELRVGVAVSPEDGEGAVRLLVRAHDRLR